MVDHWPGVCKAMGSVRNVPRETFEACGDGSVGKVLATRTQGLSSHPTTLTGNAAHPTAGEGETRASLVLTRHQSSQAGEFQVLRETLSQEVR